MTDNVQLHGNLGLTSEDTTSPGECGLRSVPVNINQ